MSKSGRSGDRKTVFVSASCNWLYELTMCSLQVTEADYQLTSTVFWYKICTATSTVRKSTHPFQFSTHFWLPPFKWSIFWNQNLKNKEQPLITSAAHHAMDRTVCCTQSAPAANADINAKYLHKTTIHIRMFMSVSYSSNWPTVPAHDFQNKRTLMTETHSWQLSRDTSKQEKYLFGARPKMSQAVNITSNAMSIKKWMRWGRVHGWATW